MPTAVKQEEEENDFLQLLASGTHGRYGKCKQIKWCTEQINLIKLNKTHVYYLNQNDVLVINKKYRT